MSGLVLRPTYWANVSGGKDSLYMLNLILHNRDKYPLDGIVHYELEIDYPFIKNAIDYMERECLLHGVRFVRIKPRKSWAELYDKYGFPTRKARWCNSVYKLDAKKQLVEWQKTLGKYVVHYIGYCADEKERYYLRDEKTEVYPLVDFNIEERVILKWAKTQPLFNNYYLVNNRCGCMYCPMSSKLNMAYLLKYYPEHFYYMMNMARETEDIRTYELRRPFSVFSSNAKYDVPYIENIVRNKWLPIYNEREAKAIEALNSRSGL